MAKKRRRQKLQPRPVKNPNAAPPMRAPAPAADEQFAPSAPPTGMPTANMPPTDMPMIPRPEEQGYARGGSVRLDRPGKNPHYGTDIVPGDYGPGGGGGGGGASRPRWNADSSPIDENATPGGIDPYSTENIGRFIWPSVPRRQDMPWLGGDGDGMARGGTVRRGYANGGDVDPMGYVPDQPMRDAQPQQPQFDPYNLVGRQEPIISPYAAVRPETGYARGGPIPAAQVPAYTDPVYPAPSAANADLYAKMAAARERTINPPPLPSRAPMFAPAPAPAPTYGPEYQRLTGTVSRPPGYAEGGLVEDDYAAPAPSDGLLAQQQLDEERRRQAAAQQPQQAEVTPAGGRTGYAEPAPAAAQTQPSTFSQVLDYLHDKFGVGSAQAADTPVRPQASPMTGYSGGYGGDLTTTPTPPPTNALEESQRNPPPVGAPLSLQSDAPPSISGQRDTASVPQAPGSSRLAQVQREIAERPASGSPDEGLLTKLARVPGALIERASDASRLKDAEREQYTGSRWGISDTDRPIMPQIHAGIDKLLRGDRAPTLPEAQQIISTIQNDPQADHNQMVQKTFDHAVKTQGPDAGAAVVQAMRPGYDNYLGIAQAALANGNWQMAAKFVEQAHNLLPNNQKLNITSSGEGGGFLATVRPEGPGGGAAYSVRLPNADALHKLVTEGMQFDSVGKNGLEKTLRGLVEPKQPAAAPAGGVAAAPVGTSRLEDVPAGGRGQLLPGDKPVRPIAPGETGYAESAAQNLRQQEEDRRFQQLGGRRDIGVAPARAQGAPAPLSTADIQRAVRPVGNEPIDRAAADRDARSAASRAEFSQRVHGRPDPNAPVATPEQAARGAAAPGNYQQAREQLVSGYNRLVEDAKPRNVAAAVNDPRRDPRTETKWAEQQRSAGSTTAPSRGGGGGSTFDKSSSRTPNTTVVPGAESHFVPDAAAQAVENERRQRAQEALKAYGPAPWERPGWHNEANRPLPSSVHATGPIQTGQGAPVSDIPNKAVEALIGDPKRAAEFDLKYGPGASRRILGGQARY